VTVPSQPRRSGLRLADALSSPGAKRQYNRRLFTTIAPRYDLATRILSYGQDQRWKDRLVARADVRGGDAALDVACGTGDLAGRLAAAGARVIGIDLAPEMLAVARRRYAGYVRWAAADIGALPFAAGTFDVVTAGYGLRNVPDLDASLRELARVLKPGGRLLSLDFERPARLPIRLAYLAYLWVVGSALGVVLHGDPDTYRYISASLARYPGAAAVAGRMRATGFDSAEWQPVLGGFMAVHVARRGGSRYADERTQAVGGGLSRQREPRKADHETPASS
jgi:demethylmenaquinone methyltransferase/2-methoxy-6-polyprenyl-1,4-benzoquinol methylase